MACPPPWTIQVRPYGKAWLIRVEASAPPNTTLMSAADYDKSIEAGH
jgi:glycine cleavage system H lipoate-binding protein